MNSGRFEGRRGQKRLREIQTQIELLRDETGCEYENTPEMIFLQDETGWEEIARLHFAIALKDVHVKWNGVKDYGFIRLSSSWVRSRKLPVVTCSDVEHMTADILPQMMAEEIMEEIAALEIE